MDQPITKLLEGEPMHLSEVVLDGACQKGISSDPPSYAVVIDMEEVKTLR